MRKKALFMICGFLAIGVAVFAADPAEGYWKSVDEKTGEATAFWNIYVKNNVLYGEIVRIVDKPDDTIADKTKESYPGFPVSGIVNKMKVIGTPWIWGLTSKKAGNWAGGKIIDLQSGDMYNCKVTYRPADGKRYVKDTLEMRGELFLGIGRSQFWLRADPSEFR